jgi:hypothetical protein
MNDTLLYGLATMGFGFLAVLVRYGFKSKCSDVSICCGLLSIKRDIVGEVKAEQMELSIRRQDSMMSVNTPGKDESKV